MDTWEEGTWRRGQGQRREKGTETQREEDRDPGGRDRDPERGGQRPRERGTETQRGDRDPERGGTETQRQEWGDRDPERGKDRDGQMGRHSV